MSKTLAAPGERLGADAVPPQSPPDLYGLIRTGAVFAGLVVTELKLTLADGRVQKLQLPPPPDRADDDAADLSPMKREVVQVVDEMGVGEVLSFEQIAEKAGYSNSDYLRVFVRSLETAGRLRRVRNGWEKVC